MWLVGGGWFGLGRGRLGEGWWASCVDCVLPRRGRLTGGRCAVFDLLFPLYRYVCLSSLTYPFIGQKESPIDIGGLCDVVFL